MSIEAMKQALEALEEVDGAVLEILGRIVVQPEKDALGDKVLRAITALRATIKQAEQHGDAVAVVSYYSNRKFSGGYRHEFYSPVPVELGTKLYIADQPAREWVGLTDAEKLALMERADGSEMSDYEFMDAIESKLREKNAGQPVKEK